MDVRARSAAGSLLQAWHWLRRCPLGLCLAALTVLSVVYVGYVYGRGDSAVYIPLIRHAADPTYLRNDWFIAHEGGLHLPYIWIMGQLSRLLGLPTTLALAHLAERFLLVVGIYVLSQQLRRDRVAGLLAVVIVAISYDWNLGGNAFVAPMTIPHTLATVPAVFSFALFLRGSYRGAAALAAVATYAHVLIGLEIMLVMGAVWLLHTRPPFKELVLASGVYALLAAPALLPVVVGQLASLRVTTLSAADYVSIAAGIRAPWHYLPSTWPLEAYLSFAVYVVGGLIAERVVADRLDRGRNAQVKRVLGVIVALCVIGTVFVEWVPSSLVMKLQFFRLTIFFKLFVSLYVAYYLTDLLRRERGLGMVLGAATVAGVGEPLLFGGAFTAATVTTLRRGWPGRSSPAVPGAAVGLLTMLWVALAATRLLPEGLSAASVELPVSHKKLVLVAVVAGGVGCWQFVTALARRRYLPAALAGVLVTSAVVVGGAVLLGNVGWGRLRNTVVRRVDPRIHVEDDWARMCAWTRTHTPPDAVFLTPPYKEDFRVRAERAVVFEFKPFTFREEDAREWRARLGAVTGDMAFAKRGDRYEEMRRGWAALSAERRRELAIEYGASFVVLERPPDAPGLRTVYRNTSYALAAVTPVPSGSPRDRR